MVDKPEPNCMFFITDEIPFKVEKSNWIDLAFE